MLDNLCSCHPAPILIPINTAGMLGGEPVCIYSSLVTAESIRRAAKTRLYPCARSLRCGALCGR